MNQEYVLPSDLVILSRADLQGNIVEYNTGFRDASGYSDAELSGKPHSILRHPDMPKEAFQDFWQTLKAGRPWFGIVKNKRKNGDYYWVAANAAPIVDNGRTTGYVSVRYPATREQIANTERLYADIRAQRVAMPWTETDRKTPAITMGVAGLGMVSIVTGLVLSGAFSDPLLLLTGIIPIGILGYLAYQTLTLRHPSVAQQKAIEGLNNGAFSRKIEGNDPWSYALNLIRSRMAEFAAKNYDAMKESAVLTTAMNSASTNLMVADADFNIVSINKSLLEMFQRNERALQSVLPHFRANSVVGSNMDIFHKQPAHQRQMVASLSQSWTGDLTLAGLVLRLTVVPIVNHGIKVGYVVEWLDRTQESRIAEDIVRVTNAMKEGSFNERITVEASGAFDEMKVNLNGALSNIAMSIDAISEVVGAQALGDLTKVLPSGTFKGQLHDLKNAINYSSAKVKEVVAQTVASSNVVSEAAEQVSQGASDLSVRVQEQAAALEETSATMHEMTSAVQANTENAAKVAELAHQVQDHSKDGVAVMQQTIEAMKSIQDASSKIADIVNIIDSIAFQTNLLALNAAVEAARAGEHGRGFAVVASEVRALAGKSADAAKDIKTLINDSVVRIDAGTKLADKSGEMLAGMSQSVAQVATMIESISSASREQNTSINQIHKAIADIDRVTQENAALVEETTAAAESLSSEANNLRSNTSFFKTGAATVISMRANTVGVNSRSRPALPAPKKSNNQEWGEF